MPTYGTSFINTPGCLGSMINMASNRDNGNCSSISPQGGESLFGALSALAGAISAMAGSQVGGQNWGPATVAPNYAYYNNGMGGSGRALATNSMSPYESNYRMGFPSTADTKGTPTMPVSALPMAKKPTFPTCYYGNH